MANIRTFDLTVTQRGTKLTPNFTLGELCCPCGCKSAKIDLDMLGIAQAARDYFGRPVYANPWYRCEPYNKSIGGADNSNHLTGRAGDLDIGAGNQQIDPLIVAMFFECMYGLPGGIGLYIYPDGRSWVHVDNTGVGRYWRSTRPGVPYTYVDTFVPNLRRTLLRTDRVEVRCLQHLLARCGYTVSEDGWFGAQTKAAVIIFQKQQKLTVDGVAGKKTFTRLFQLAKTW